MLTRDEMVEIINRRESVLFNGTNISSIADLPTEAELAQGDPKKEAAAKKKLVAQQADIDKQLAILSKDDSKPKADAAKTKAPEAEKEAKQ